MHVQVEPGRAEDWHQTADEPIQQVQARQFGARFDQTVVIGSEDAQPIARTCSTGEAHQERDERVERQFALRIIRSGDPRFTGKNGGRELRQDRFQVIAQCGGFCISQYFESTQQFIRAAKLVLEIAFAATRGLGRLLRRLVDLGCVAGKRDRGHAGGGFVRGKVVHGVGQAGAGEKREMF